MAIIQVTPGFLSGKATDVRKLRTEHEQTMQQLTQLVNGLCDQWKGGAQDAFVAKYRSMDVTFKNFAEMLESYARLMDTAAVELQNTDQALKAMIQNL